MIGAFHQVTKYLTCITIIRNISLHYNHKHRSSLYTATKQTNIYKIYTIRAIAIIVIIIYNQIVLQQKCVYIAQAQIIQLLLNFNGTI